MSVLARRFSASVIMVRVWIIIGAALALAGCGSAGDSWQALDNFQQSETLEGWTNIDVQNETDPFVESPQISERRVEGSNAYMLRKPAADGVIGNRKAIGFKALPAPIAVGETATLYTRIYVDSFPNNHSYGLTNLAAAQIPGGHYNAFEPMIRITDKAESNGDKNDGTLMVLSGENKAYAKIQNLKTGADAAPLIPGQWYEVWAVINNAPREAGGQRYNLYMRGGEFKDQALVFEGADFRMRRKAPLGYFMAISNTGPARAPYGNGGVRYDDIYLAKGRALSRP